MTVDDCGGDDQRSVAAAIGGEGDWRSTAEIADDDRLSATTINSDRR